MKRNITKQLLRLRVSVRDSDSIRAGTARGGNSETRAFDAISISSVKNVDCFMSLRRCYLDKAVTLLFRNSTMKRYKGNVGCCLFQNTRIRDLL